MWKKCNDGNTAGTLAFENQTILLDEECGSLGHITLKKENGCKKFTIVGGVYGNMMHMKSAHNETEAKRQYEAMKRLLTASIMLNYSTVDAGAVMTWLTNTD